MTAASCACSIPAVSRTNQRAFLTVRHRHRGVHVRVGEPRRLRLPGPALMVPRLDDRVRPAPTTTHREDHPGAGAAGGYVLNPSSARLGSQLLQHPLSKAPPKGGSVYRSPCPCLHHRPRVLVLGPAEAAAAAAFRRQQLTRTHPR